jgi:tetratricopeptide (TPR) repeat protein
VALEEYGARCPDGIHAPDVALARIDALLALGRRGEALRVLSGLGGAAIEGLPRAVELRVLRGELLAEAKRCLEAMPDFERALEHGGAAGLEERALWGRASCRATLGRNDAARADLERYLARFPEGRFAAQARGALGR